jgi:hypothetical protein
LAFSLRDTHAPPGRWISMSTRQTRPASLRVVAGPFTRLGRPCLKHELSGWRCRNRHGQAITRPASRWARPILVRRNDQLSDLMNLRRAITSLLRAPCLNFHSDCPGARRRERRAFGRRSILVPQAHDNVPPFALIAPGNEAPREPCASGCRSFFSSPRPTA